MPDIYLCLNLTIPESRWSDALARVNALEIPEYKWIDQRVALGIISPPVPHKTLASAIEKFGWVVEVYKDQGEGVLQVIGHSDEDPCGIEMEVIKSIYSFFPPEAQIQYWREFEVLLFRDGDWTTGQVSFA